MSSAATRTGRQRSPVLRTYSLRPELAATARLGGPLALAELGWMSTYLVDAIMVGRLAQGVSAIAASSLGNTIYYSIVFFGVGLLYGVDTLVAQAFGRGDRQQSLLCFAQSLWLVALWTPATYLLTLVAGPLMRWDGIEPALVAETVSYLHALVWSTLPLLLYMALRHYLQAVNRTMMIMISLLTANAVNFVADWALLFGHLGAPRMGLPGSGWATCIVRVYMLGLLLAAFVWHLRKDRLRLSARMFVPSAAPLRALLNLGWAPAVETATDLAISTVQTLLCGRLGALALAVNQVVLDIAAFVYMVPHGFEFAASVRVGQAVGAEHRSGVSLAMRVSVLICVVFGVVAGICFLLFPRQLAAIDTASPAVIAGSVGIFAIAAIYQATDACDAALSGALRGLGDTRTPFYIGGFWSWPIGIPLTWWLTLHTPLGVHGLWIGRAIPSVLTATSMLLLWRSRFNRLYPPTAAPVTLLPSTRGFPDNISAAAKI